ncbi:septum site-determining protein MinC [Chengkuizengella axinellae]|uniref:Probable septum site-determining protein MinC n=1 Tax=Chengkuizengella axinellae TaxID=3064388 RepID=A0ABT9IV93_9BACL|nr:septum site-determining protein MinC [Chengkuizengella sp. 2205SS18-9]MDP5272730.1 septum site-determining protein MinC [Chengkuizengella sp. 2205SS18-9]
MTATKEHVTIKGNKDGLVFLFNDHCEFPDLLSELQYKLEKSHQQILSGPTIDVHIKLGERELDVQQEEEIKKLVGHHGNLLIQSIESTPKEQIEKNIHQDLKIMNGIVRSGQSIHEDAPILFMGDVNPGGMISSNGDIYVMGALRGLAHAGKNGNKDAIIAASYMRPTQLRIANIVSRSPDESANEGAYMEFAYLDEDHMQVGKISELHKVRPVALQF